VVYAYTVVHRPAFPALAADVPYVVALVDLAEGARLMTNIVDCPPESVAVGLAVHVQFRSPVPGTHAVPVFAP
jgi:uncharacterized OB-fold protein